MARAPEGKKGLTNEMLVELEIRKNKALIAILTQAIRIAGDDDDITDPVQEALNVAKDTLKWCESGKALAAFNDAGYEEEDPDMYAPEVLTLDNLDLSSFEDTPERLAAYKDAVQHRDDAFARARAASPYCNQNIANAVQGVM